jgi:hypothetical protein
VYVDRADRAHYKLLFDEVQSIVQKHTGQPIRFKRLSPGGNNPAKNATQVIGAADSFLPTNEPECSDITTNDPAVLAEYFVKACHTHVTNYVHTFHDRG